MHISRRNALKLAALGIVSAAAEGTGALLKPPIVGVKADSGPNRSECGVGALIAWADRLWVVTYVSSRGGRSGSGVGLYSIDEDLNSQQVHISNGVYANRMLHAPTDQVIIGPYIIDMEGNFRVINDLLDHRLTATMTHLTDPENKVYFLTMEGPLFELDVRTLKARLIIDLTEEFKIKTQPHFKGAYTSGGRVVVANNSYYGLGNADGKLAEWDGKTWTVIEHTAFMDVSALRSIGDAIFANGWDDSSAILRVFTGEKWKRYRLPKSSHTYDHGWTTEWTRIRAVETERLLMDCHGMFYDLSPLNYGDSIWGVRPICSHLRIVPDFCSFRGMFVMGGNQATEAGRNLYAPQSQAGIWFGKTDDLWSFGKPQGWGGPWRKSNVKAGEPSDPFLMTGFDKKVLHLKESGGSGARVTIEVDFLGTGAWVQYESITLEGNGYAYHVFPDGFSAHWVRLTADSDCVATAEFIYT